MNAIVKSMKVEYSTMFCSVLIVNVSQDKDHVGGALVGKESSSSFNEDSSVMAGASFFKRMPAIVNKVMMPW